MYIKTNNRPEIRSTSCPECGSSRLLFSRGSVICKNCDHVIFKPTIKRNKYNAIKTEFNGHRYDSRFEASVAMDLEKRLAVGDIQGYDGQYRVDIPIYDRNGKVIRHIHHKVDFRIHHNDGSFELYEAKGVETSDYKWRRQFLEDIWLPEHRDHIYTVIYQHNKISKKGIDKA